MAKYKVVFAPTAEKQFLKLAKSVQLRLASALAKLSEYPLLGKLLKGELHEYRSYRVGDYRIIYSIRQKRVQVEVIRVAHRREAYR